jgi:hypothetical protein
LYISENDIETMIPFMNTRSPKKMGTFDFVCFLLHYAQ